MFFYLMIEYKNTQTQPLPLLFIFYFYKKGTLSIICHERKTDQ
jgi:hypothetical protein